jgi:hypothetical protein
MEPPSLVRIRVKPYNDDLTNLTFIENGSRYTHNNRHCKTSKTSEIEQAS